MDTAATTVYGWYTAELAEREGRLRDGDLMHKDGKMHMWVNSAVGWATIDQLLAG